MSKSRSVAWKARERLVAAFHGLKRNPLSGANSGRVGDCYDPDNLKPWVYIECKHYKRHAAISILEKHREQVRKVDKDGLCIAALSENRKHGFYVLIHSEDIVRYAMEITRRLERTTDAAYDHLGGGEAVESDDLGCGVHLKLADGDVGVTGDEEAGG